MTSIALGVFIIFIVYVMIWSIRNDGAGSIRDQTGFIRMRTPPEASPGPSQETKAESQATAPAAANRGHRKSGRQRSQPDLKDGAAPPRSPGPPSRRDRGA